MSQRFAALLLAIAIAMSVSATSAFARSTAVASADANVGYRLAEGTDVIVFARNPLDPVHIQNVTIQAGNSGLILGTPSDRSTIGGTVRLRL